jgi:methyl-accepting chemotaxis protein
MLENGDVLACSESNYATLTRQIPKSTRLMVQQNANGWIQTQDDHGNLWLTGLRKMDSPDISQGAYLMFSSMRDDVVAPLQKRLLQIGTFSIIIFTLGALVGYAMIYHHVLRPLKALGSAMRSLTATVRSKPDSEAEKQEIIRLRNNVIRDLETVGKIRTGDEIEPLARNLSEMGEKLLRYQTELENKIESNSGKANADLRE